MKKEFIFVSFLCVLAITAYFIPIGSVKAEVNNGNYSLEYLLKNYSAITFGKYDNDSSVIQNSPFPNVTKGEINNINVEGAVLVNGNYNSSTNIVFGNKAGEVQSFIKGNKGNSVSTNSTITTDSNFVNFDNMYLKVVNEQRKLLENSNKNIIGPDLVITSPGIYTINNAAVGEQELNSEGNGTLYSDLNRLIIKNYNKNDVYVFNIYDEFSSPFYNILISSNNNPSTMPLSYFATTEEYTGNIIFNYPKAKFVQNVYGGATIIAPKADVFINSSVNGTIIANSIYGSNGAIIYKGSYASSKKLIDGETANYLDEYKDYSDDLYSGSYSLRELLQNYSVVTLGKKALDSKTKLAQKGLTPGSLHLFHLAGPFLISGSLDNRDYSQDYYGTRLDLESNESTVSYIKGNSYTNYGSGYYSSNYFIQDWNDINNYKYYYYSRKNAIVEGPENSVANRTSLYGNYINFDRLYEKIIAQQAKIEEGTKVGSDEGVAHIKIGGNYVIDDISKINEIMFDDFEENKNVITVITIKNSGDVNFPLISRDNGAYKGIVTNDYYNKTKVTHSYEYDNLVKDSYHGNIIWNLPNATYIKLKENAPFAGHLIAPKADVESPELHFSGCFIVNSLYADGNTEAHFYPLTVYDNCECPSANNVSNRLQLRVNEMRLDKLLGADDSTVERVVLGDQGQYNSDVATLNKVINECPQKKNTIVQILTNPKTFATTGIVIVVIIIIGLSVMITRKKRIKSSL